MTTKFNIEETVWLLNKNKAVSGTVDGIHILKDYEIYTILIPKDYEVHTILINNIKITRESNLVFGSKTQLLNSL